MDWEERKAAGVKGYFWKDCWGGSYNILVQVPVITGTTTEQQGSSETCEHC